MENSSGGKCINCREEVLRSILKLMPAQIKFGTSGWPAIMAEDFTVSNIRRAVGGIARYVAEKHPGGGRVIVGRDPRYMGERFVQIAAEELAATGVKPLVIAEAAP